MSLKRIPFALIFPILLAGCASENPPSPMTEFIGTWKVDFEESFAFVLEQQDSLGVDSLQFHGYLEQMSKIVEMGIADSTMSLQRGKHFREFPYSITRVGEEGVQVATDSMENNYDLVLKLDEKGYLHVRSTKPNFREMFIYRRATAEDSILRPGAAPDSLQ